jgi:hypothetical protein
MSWNVLHWNSFIFNLSRNLIYKLLDNLSKKKYPSNFYQPSRTNFCQIVSLTFISYNNQQKSIIVKNIRRQYCPWVTILYLSLFPTDIFHLVSHSRIIWAVSIFLKTLQCDFPKSCLKFIILKIIYRHWYSLKLYL